jgi:hypothetical protein
MAPGAGGRLRVASSVPSETFAKRVRFRARVSEQLGFPYRRDLRHPRARRKALCGTWPRARGRRLAVPGVAPAAAPGAAQAAGDSRPVTRGTHHRATPVCSRQAPAIAPVACSRRMPLSHHGHRGRATASPALYHAQPPNPTFLPHHPVPFTPNEPPPARNPRPPGIPARPRIRPAPRSPRRPCFGPPLPVRPRSRRRTLWNAMKPGIQCVLTPWIRGFTTPCVLRSASYIRRPAPGALRPAAGRPGTTPRNPPARTRVPAERTPNPNANRAQPPNSRQTFSHSQ